jgi:hypothetical protein
MDPAIASDLIAEDLSIAKTLQIKLKSRMTSLLIDISPGIDTSHARTFLQTFAEPFVKSPIPYAHEVSNHRDGEGDSPRSLSTFDPLIRGGRCRSLYLVRC